MATTNPSTIRTALETTLAAVTPVGSAEGSAAYQVAAPGFEWENRPAADVDREFTIGDIPPGTVPWVGLHTEALCETQIEIIIGHAMTDDVSAGEARRERDIAQIVRKLEWPTSYPTSVAIIHYAGASYSRHPGDPDGYWITRLRFDLQYLADPDGE